MKIAKKVLALVMAVALVGCFAVMAFAADGAKIALSATTPNEKGLVEVTVNAVDCTGLKSFDFVVTVDNDAKLVKAGYTADNTDATNAGNAITNEFNAAEGKLSGYFKENLWTTDEFKAAADALYEDISASFSAENFGLSVITVKVPDGAAATVTVKGVAVIGNDNVEVEASVKVGAEPETTTEATTVADVTTTEATTAAETTTSKPAATSKPTGDNSVIAIAAGVVVLAGAALVVTKKRK